MSTPAVLLRNAAYHGDVDLVRRLLAENVDPNVPDERRRTALLLATKQGHLEVVEVLLSGGAWVDLDEEYDTYETALMAAVTGGHLEIVKRLIEAGANPDWHVGVTQANAEFYARSYGQKEVLAYLIGRRTN